MDEASLSPADAARVLGISESEADKLARPDARVPLETIRDRAGATTVALKLARELSRIRGGWSSVGQLKEVRATNSRLQKEIKESVEERRRLTEEVLELRAVAEERLMLVERA